LPVDQEHGLADITEVVVMEENLTVLLHRVTLATLYQHESCQDRLQVPMFLLESVGGPTSCELVVQLPDLGDLTVDPGHNLGEEARRAELGHLGRPIEDRAVLLKGSQQHTLSLLALLHELEDLRSAILHLRGDRLPANAHVVASIG